MLSEPVNSEKSDPPYCTLYTVHYTLYPWSSLAIQPMNIPNKYEWNVQYVGIYII